MVPNQNPETGIRYGVASLDSLAEWVWEEFALQGRNLTSEAAWEEFKSELGREPTEEEDRDFWDGYMGEEEEYELEADGMKLGLGYLGGAPLVWVFESPHIARVRECSPCIPGGGDLDSPDPGGFDAYTLPPAWWEKD